MPGCPYANIYGWIGNMAPCCSWIMVPLTNMDYGQQHSNYAWSAWIAVGSS